MKSPSKLAAILIITLSFALHAEEVWSSPNGKFECGVGLGSQRKGQELWVRVPAAPQSRAVVWVSEGWMEVEWSPESNCLAVIDHFTSGQSAVLIFSVLYDPKQKKIDSALLFETPLKDRRKQEWEVKGWNLKKEQVLLLKREGNARSLFTALLSDRPIEQTLYARDPRGMPVNTKKEASDGSRR